jgi:hypothetical protein
MNLRMVTEVEPVAAELPASRRASSDRTARDAAGKRTVSAFVVPAVLLLAYLAQCAWFIGTQSFTFDEPINIISGLEQWRTGQFSGGQGMNDHPPLSRILCTLPALNERFQIGDKTVPNPESVVWGNSDFDSFGRILPSPESLAWHTRPVNALLGAVLGLLLWLAARSIYSIHAANFVLALFAFSPSMIGHFSLAATNDGALTLMLFATVFQLCRWRRNQTWPQTVLLGAVLGALLISKASSLPFFMAALALALVLKADSFAIRPSQWNWRKTAAASVIAFFVVWGAYHFHVAKITLATSDVQMRIAIPNRPDPVVRQSAHVFHVTVPVPAFEFVQGLGYQLAHDERGHGGFLLGRAYRGGSRWYFPVVISLKWPTMVLALLLAAVGTIFWRRTPRPRDLALWVAFPAAYFMLAEFSKLNLGERYILPVYPFALLFCGSLWQFTKRRVVLALLLGAVAIHVMDVLRYAPDYISYFNLFVNPDGSYRLVSDSNVDWGEGLIALRKYQQAHPNEPIHLAYFGNVDPTLYGIRSIPLAPNERASGTVIVSAEFLSGQTLPDPAGYHWVLQYPTKSILNHSLYVFEVPGPAGLALSAIHPADIPGAASSTKD